MWFRPCRCVHVAAQRAVEHPARRRKLEEIRRYEELGRARIGTLNERDLLVAGVVLCAGEGSKTDQVVRFANSDAALVRLFCAWLRRFFEIDEARLRVALYLHEGLDLVAAVEHWVDVTGIPRSQFTKPYRAVPRAGVRNSKHRFGCARVSYACSATHRAIMGLVRALPTAWAER